MTRTFDPSKPATVLEHDSTLVLALELSGKSWMIGAVIAGVSRRAKVTVKAGDIGAVMRHIGRWKEEAVKGGKTIDRVVLTFEAGRDGFWIARALEARGIEVHVMQASSVPVERRRRRAKTDRIDLDLLLRTFLAWLRGEPRACSMVRVPSQTEEDAHRPGRQRQAAKRDLIALENRMESLLVLYGIVGFRPRRRDAAKQLEALRQPSGAPIPPNALAELQRMMIHHNLLGEQIKEIEAQRDRVLVEPEPNRAQAKIQLLASLVSVGAETATLLTTEMLWREFANRRRVASYSGLTGTPFDSGGSRREQGISKSGNPRVRLCMIQLAWRWLRFQPDSALSRWFDERTNGAKGRLRTVMVVALARKLLVALWRLVETGEIPEGARLKTV